MRLQQTLEKYLPLIGGMLFPAVVFTAGTLSFLSDGNFSEHGKILLHAGFYFLCLADLILLLYFNRSKSLFFMVVVFLAYIGINYLKNSFETDFMQTVWYKNLRVFLPVNLLFFYIDSGKRFLSRRSLVTVLVLMLEFSIFEFLGRAEISLSFMWRGIDAVSSFFFAVLMLTALTNAVKNGGLYDYSVLFAVFCIAFGLCFSPSASGLCLFFFMAQLFLTVFVAYTLLYNRYYDASTGFYSRSSYLLHAKNFPLKYSLGLFCIDSYDKITATIGQKNAENVAKMVASVLENEVPEDNIYRYAPDQFIVIYKKLDKKETFNRLDEIRRLVAGLGFEYSASQRPLKLTLSCSVAERKRSDAGAVEVLLRADKAMRKTLQFSHNVTSQG